MKTIDLSLLAGILVLGAVTAAVAGPFARREARQQGRIHQGVRSGEINPCEYRALEREQGAIGAHRRHAWSDGVLAPWEARQLTREQNRASRHILQFKHNSY